VSGNVGGVRATVGSAEFMTKAGIDVSEVIGHADTLRGDGQTVMFLSADGRLVALFGVADPIKPTTAEAVAALRAQGLRIIMLTGDNERTARAVAARLGLDDVRAGVLPADKRHVVQQLQREGRVVAMAGDGVNDAPALAEAAVGIAMGTGADVAIESAGITLVKGDLRGIVRARRLSRATMTNIRQNLFLAFVYNAVGVPVAAGVLYPWTGTLLSPIWASAAMTLSSVSVIVNALRLGRLDLQGDGSKRPAEPSRTAPPMQAAAVAVARGGPEAGGRKMAIDPVCKMQVDENKAAGESEYQGKTYYFCSPVCKRKFDANPAQYVQHEPQGSRA
jgi:Cu+-exporting ATPase